MGAAQAASVAEEDSTPTRGGEKRRLEEPMAEAKAVKRQKLSQELESSVVVDSQELECSTHYIVYAYANLPIVHMYPPVVQKILPSLH